MDARVNVVLLLRFDRRLLQNTTKRRLNMASGATKPIIQIEMAEGGIKIILEEPANNISTDPDAFRIAGRTGHLLGRFGQFVGLRRVLFRIGGLLLGLVLVRIGLRQSRTANKCGQTEKGSGGDDADRHDGG